MKLLMKRILSIIMLIVAVACSSTDDIDLNAQTVEGGKTLVVYYSFTNNVRTIVGELSKQISADVVEVEPAEEGLDYAANNYEIGSSLITAIREHPNDAASYPAIKPVSVDFSRYDNVIVAAPLWWSQMAAPMQSFLFKFGKELSGKKIGLIVSSSSTGISAVVGDAKRLIVGGQFVEPNLWIRSSQVKNAADMISKWLVQTGFNKSENSAETMRIKVSDGTNSVTFELNATSAAKSLYSMLPMEVAVENYGGNEKIFYPTQTVAHGSDCIEGDCPVGTLALFSPWGNVVMYYGAASRYSGLYILGHAIDGTQKIKDLTGTIKVEAVGTTGITEINAREEQRGFTVYTLDGRRVVAEADSLTGLPSGVYVVNGKKQVVR